MASRDTSVFVQSPKVGGGGGGKKGKKKRKKQHLPNGRMEALFVNHNKIDKIGWSCFPLSIAICFNDPENCAKLMKTAGLVKNEIMIWLKCFYAFVRYFLDIAV